MASAPKSRKKTAGKKAAAKSATAKPKARSTGSQTKPTAMKSGSPKRKASSKKSATSTNSSSTKTRPSSSKKAARKKTTTKAAAKTKKEELEIPAILLEGDETPTQSTGGPGSRYDLGASSSGGDDLGELPDAYGTRSLILTARDPHWLYAFWDFTHEQLREANRASRDGHLIVRVFEAGIDAPVPETHVHPESKNWFLPVKNPGATYTSELGYYNADGEWNSLSQSQPIQTPSDELSDDSDAEFVTLPVEVPFQQLIDLVKHAIADEIPLVEAIQQLRAEGYEGLPNPEFFSVEDQPNWTPAQERALAEVVTLDDVRRVWVGSHEVTELVRKQLVGDLSSLSAAGAGHAISSFGVSSPLGGVPEGRRGF